MSSSPTTTPAAEDRSRWPELYDDAETVWYVPPYYRALAADGLPFYRRSEEDDLTDSVEAGHTVDRERIIQYGPLFESAGVKDSRKSQTISPTTNPEHMRIWQHTQALNRALLRWRNEEQAREARERDAAANTCPLCGRYAVMTYTPWNQRGVALRVLPGGGQARMCGRCWDVCLAVQIRDAEAELVAGDRTRLEAVEALLASTHESP